MPRDLDIQSMIDLPSLTAAAGLALATALLTRIEAELERAKKAKQKDLIPPSILEAREDLVAATDALSKGIGKGLGPAIDRGSLRAADRRIKSAWSAVNPWLASRARLQSVSEEKKAAQARLSKELLPTGLGWMRGATYQETWGETSKRLQRIPGAELVALFKLLGGEDYLAELQASYKAFGDDLGVTSVPTAPEPGDRPTTERALLDAVKEAIREYLARVATSVSKKHPETRELADRLSEPYRTWETKERIAAEAPQTPNAPAAAAGPEAGAEK